MRPVSALAIPSPSLLVMIGIAGSGKTTFCRRHFASTEIVGPDAPQACHERIERRLRRGLMTVVDGDCVSASARAPLVRLAERHNLPAIACLLDLPVERCIAHDRHRPEPRAGRAAILRQRDTLAASLQGLASEGFARVHRLRSPEAAAAAAIEPEPLPCDLRHVSGPFDLIGDVHGCAGELAGLLRRLGYRQRSARAAFRHPRGRRAVLLGDLVDRGPGIVAAARMAMRMVEAGSAFCVPGNHEETLLQVLDGAPLERSPGIVCSLDQIEALPKGRRERFIDELRRFIGGLPHHLVLDGGRLAAVHAGLKTEHVGRHSEMVRRFALRGETTGEIDRYGLPTRVRWAAAYRGRALVVYGHTPVPAPEWIRNTVNIDTGCVYGGRLSALRYPERTIVSVRAERAYYHPHRLPARVGLRAETRAEPLDETRPEMGDAVRSEPGAER